MKKPVKDDSGHAAAAAVRDQEVMRAQRELAAYFKGLRTEREARAALKIIKAFIKGRERSDAARRRPFPGLEPAPAAAKRARARRRKKVAEASGARAKRRSTEQASEPSTEVSDGSAAAGGPQEPAADAQ